MKSIGKEGDREGHIPAYFPQDGNIVYHDAEFTGCAGRK